MVLGLHAFARASEIDFGVTDDPGWFPLNFENRIVYDLRESKDPEHSAVTHHGVPVRYWN